VVTAIGVAAHCHVLRSIADAAILRDTRNRTTKDAAWVRGLLACKPAKVAAVALANKTARIVWAVMARGEAYRRARMLLGSWRMRHPTLTLILTPRHLFR
jgi:hypothetical protein